MIDDGVFMKRDFRSFIQKEAIPAIISWIALSLIWYLVRTGITTDIKAAIEAIGSSLALTVLWLTIRYSAAQQIEDFIDRQPKAKIMIHEQTFVDAMKDCVPLWKHYTDSLSELFNNITSLKAGSTVQINPYSIYALILSCAERCENQIYSVDCDLNAWYYLCEADDFDIILNTKTSDDCQIQKDQFLSERRQRARTDFTYKLSKTLLQRVQQGGSLLGRNPIKRVFVIRNIESNLTDKQKIIIHRIRKLQDLVKGRMRNKVVFIPELDKADSTLLEILKTLQDIVIFDGVVAFKEFLLDPKDERAEKGEMFIDVEDIDKHVKAFDLLFTKYGKNIHDIQI